MRKIESHSFGNNLKELRISKGLTQEKLAEELNIRYKLNESKPTISQYENNRRVPDLDKIVNIADYFNVSLDYLINKESSNYIKENKKVFNLANELENHLDLLLQEKNIDTINLSYKSTIGDRLKKLIKQNNLTQKEFMEKFNAKYGYSDSEATVSQYVNNKRTPEVDKLIKIADYFNVSLDYLFNRNFINSALCYTDTNFINNVTFPDRLRQLRKNTKLSQVELAKIINVSNGSISKWETGERQPDYATLKSLAEFFNVSTDYLIGIEKTTNQFSSVNDVVRFMLNQNVILKLINEDTQKIDSNDLKKMEEDFIDILKIVLRKHKK